jgi:hypothetical protein
MVAARVELYDGAMGSRKLWLILTGFALALGATVLVLPGAIPGVRPGKPPPELPPTAPAAREVQGAGAPPAGWRVPVAGFCRGEVDALAAAELLPGIEAPGAPRELWGELLAAQGAFASCPEDRVANVALLALESRDDSVWDELWAGLRRLETDRGPAGCGHRLLCLESGLRDRATGEARPGAVALARQVGRHPGGTGFLSSPRVGERLVSRSAEPGLDRSLLALWAAQAQACWLQEELGAARRHQPCLGLLADALTRSCDPGRERPPAATTDPEALAVILQVRGWNHLDDLLGALPAGRGYACARQLPDLIVRRPDLVLQGLQAFEPDWRGPTLHLLTRCALVLPFETRARYPEVYVTFHQRAVADLEAAGSPGELEEIVNLSIARLGDSCADASLSLQAFASPPGGEASHRSQAAHAVAAHLRRVGQGYVEPLQADELAALQQVFRWVDGLGERGTDRRFLEGDLVVSCLELPAEMLAAIRTVVDLCRWSSEAHSEINHMLDPRSGTPDAETSARLRRLCTR